MSTHKPKVYQPRHREAPGRTFTHRKEWLSLYDVAWEKYRTRFLAENPKCYSCGTYSTIVDHLIPHRGDVELFKKRSNHIPLCKKCHDTVTAKFDRMHFAGKSINPKMYWLSQRREESHNFLRIRVLPSYD